MGVLIFPSLASTDEEPPVRASDAAEPRPALDAPRFDTLVSRYRRPLLSFFQRRSVGAEDAEDLTQEVFMRLSRRFARLHWGNPDGLVFTVAANALIDHERHERSRRRDRHVEVDPGLPDEEPSAETALAGRERLRSLVAALDTLSPSVRAAFVLCRFEGLTQAEAAARLGVSVSAVEKHMMTALARLRLAIGTEHDA
jgi:RNA polymerase sigma-70 factor (ECF subfamily)